MKRAILWIAGGIVAGVALWWLAPAYFAGREDPRSIERLSREAAALNRSLPAMLDGQTELMVTEAAHAMFVYKYRLLNVAVDKIDGAKFIAGAKPQLVQSACNRPETRNDFLTKGVTMRFSYFDKDKRHIATIDVSPADCGL
ncbi:MAG TPA: hypothetical protein VNM15_01585 [Candidatus Binatia bacterium]|nr:hypothetical protein [Candidatus Binatia bacterium]